MKKFKTFLTVIGAVTILVLAANSAVYAATGGKFILGQTNKANKVSTLKRTTSGSALNLVTKSSANAPFTANGRGKVGNLNADMIDGLDSSALMGVRANVYRYAFTTSSSAHEQTLPTLSPGVYLATFNVVLSGAGGTQAAPTGSYCEFLQSGVQHGIVQVTSSLAGWDPIFSSATVLSTANGNSIKLRCSSTAAWTTSTTYPAEVTLTKLDSGSIAATTTSSGRIAPGTRIAPVS